MTTATDGRPAGWGWGARRLHHFGPNRLTADCGRWKRYDRNVDEVLEDGPTGDPRADCRRCVERQPAETLEPLEGASC